MSFEADRLKAVGGQDNRDFGGDIYSYTPSSDILATIIAANFFLPAQERLNVNDIIRIIASDGQADFLVLTSTDKGVTIVVFPPPKLTFEDLGVAGPGEVISLNTDITLMASTGTATPTLAVGTLGQQKSIVLVNDGGTVTLAVGGIGITQVVFADLNDSIVMAFLDNGWRVLSSNGAPGITGA